MIFLAGFWKPQFFQKVHGHVENGVIRAADRGAVFSRALFACQMDSHLKDSSGVHVYH